MEDDTMTLSRPAADAGGKKGVMLMNRIGPAASTLYIANADGSDERMLLPEGNQDYHASFSPDGESVSYTHLTLPTIYSV